MKQAERRRMCGLLVDDFINITQITVLLWCSYVTRGMDDKMVVNC